MSENEIINTSVFDMSEVSQDEMGQMVDGTLAEFDEGDLVTGTVVKIEHDEVLVDIGFKSEGVIPLRELSIRKDIDPEQALNLGDEIETLVLQKEDKEGRLILSYKRAQYERAWKRVEDKFNNGENVEGEVIEVVKGGLILDIGLRGFLPASLVDLRRVKELDSYLGQTLEARIIEMDRNRNNVVLSRRVVLEESRKSERNEILSRLKKGMRLKGSVSSIVDFGAFVDLGGIDGLVHISELSWSHVNHPSEVVKVGQEVEVEVLEVDLNRERISLGLKQTTEDPWHSLVKNYPVGAIVDGKITKLVPFGVFVELGDGIEGLVHISEMAKGHVDTPSQVAHVGDEVKVKVMDVSVERRRISLSMKAAAEALGTTIEVAPLDSDDSEEQAEPEAEAAAASDAAPAVEEPATEESAPAAEEPAAEESAESVEEETAEQTAQAASAEPSEEQEPSDAPQEAQGEAGAEEETCPVDAPVEDACPLQPPADVADDQPASDYQPAVNEEPVADEEPAAEDAASEDQPEADKEPAAE